MPHRIAVVGCGKIAQTQHLPAIAADPRFVLAATIDPAPADHGAPRFASLDALLADGLAIDAVALCTPPQIRATLAHQALAAGLHVLLEKPPAATPCEVAALAAAVPAGQTLHATWHSRHGPMIAAARAWLAKRPIRSGRLVWREDAHRWHPGQHWLWQPGGLGVFDPTINAFSILTEITDVPWTMARADFQVPKGLHAPISAQLELRAGEASIEADLDFRDDETAEWTIRLETDDGPLELRQGGAALALPGEPVREEARVEYPGVYDRFATLIERGACDVDARPLQLAADAFLIARTSLTDPFEP